MVKCTFLGCLRGKPPTLPFLPPPTAVLFVSKCKFCVMNIALRSGMVHYTLTDYGISRISRIVFGSCRTHLVVKEIYMPIIFSDI